MSRLVDRHGARLAWGLVALAALVTAGHVALLASDPHDGTLTGVALAGTVLGATAACGAWVVTTEPRNRIGWLLVALVFMPVIELPLDTTARRLLERDQASLPGHVCGFASSLLGGPSAFLALLLIALLFPDGRLPGPRWRPYAWLGPGLLLLAGAGEALRDGADGYTGRPNPVGVVPLALADALFPALALLGVLASTAAIAVRYRRAGAVERLQLRWVGTAIGCTVSGAFLAGAIGTATGASWLWGIVMVLATSIPIAIAVAVTRHRLYDIDLVLSRTLVYGALTAVVLALYGGVIWIAGTIAGDRAGQAAALVAAVLVAVGAAPLRDRLQRAVNRLLFGGREEPLAALALLGDRLAASLTPDAVLPALAEGVASALRVPYVAIELAGADGPAVAAAVGAPRPAPVSVPVIWEGEPVARRALAARADGAPLDGRDRRLLASLARQAGPAVRAVRLERELRASREAIVTAREEERRRLRRDLHDGLGPQLAAIAMQLAVAARSTDDPEIAELAAGLERDARGAIADVRRVVEELRPPQLDEYGLVGALENQARRLAGGLAVTIDVEGALADLPAAVEVAAYRIAVEALAAAAARTGATRCRVGLRRNGALDLEVEDDGRVAPERRAAGSVTMGERARELGGTLVVEPTAGGGTRVIAHLPLPEEPPRG